MDARMISFGLITFLHNLFTVIWIGGMITIGITALPAARQMFGKSHQTKELMRMILNRQSWLAYISMLGLIMTGVLIARRTPGFDGLLSTRSAYSIILSIKHGLVILMLVASLYRSLILGRKITPLSVAQEKANALLLYTNIGLGTIVLLLSAALSAMRAVSI
jgi:copper resistance protein D